MNKLIAATSMVLMLASPMAGAAANKGTAIDALDEKLSAWNKHDLNHVLDAYLHSADTSFVSSSGTEVYGFEELKKRYKKWYEKDPKSMGSIMVSDLHDIKLDKNFSMLTGKYVMKEPNQTEMHGVFTLVFALTSKGWKIEHEHLSVLKEGK